MNLFGVIMGISAFFLIGLGFVWVIRLERYLGYQWAPVVFGIGIVMVIATLFIQPDYAAGLLGILGGTVIWGASELKEQSRRCELGWYPKHERKILPPWLR